MRLGPCHHTTHAYSCAWLILQRMSETEVWSIPRRLSSVIIGLLALVACCVAPVTAADKIKIGYIATMSGPAASLGQDILDGFKLGMTHVGNMLGGLPVDLIVGDDQLKPDVGVQVASKMVEKDKVDFITGVVFSNVMMAIAQPVTEAGVFLSSANAGPSPLAGAGCLQNLFTVSWQNDQTHEALRNKDKLRTALRQASFASVRGGFKLNHNHFPIQDFYICQVVKKSDGVITQELQAIAFKDHADAYHEQCTMRW
jgi:hypothetical protein